MIRCAFFLWAALSVFTSPLPTARAAVHEEAVSGLRLATFDAAWRIIHDTYFDPHFHGIDWNAVREELRPRAESAADMEELREIIRSMLDRLGQSHLSIIPSELAETVDPDLETDDDAGSSEAGKGSETSGQDGESDENGDLGLDVRLIDGRVTVTRVDADGPAQRAGVKPGWIVESAGKRSLTEALEKFPEGIDPRQAEFLVWKLALGTMVGNVGSSVRMKFLDHEDELVELDLVRRPLMGEPAKLGHLPEMHAWLRSGSLKTPEGADAGWIHFNVWMIPVAQPFDEAVDRFRGTAGIIIDLRGNLGGIGGMIMGFSGHFLDEHLSLGTMKMRGMELRFIANPRRVNLQGNRVSPYDGPVAILTDGLSLSAAEIFAGGMQDIGRATVFGQTTGGQALPALFDELPNGDVLYHAIADYVTPSGTRLEGRGVIPDRAVTVHRDDLMRGRDPVLAAALTWIDGEQRRKPGRVAE